MSEYIIARSDDSIQYHPANVAYEYTVALNQTLELGTHWLVGLSEISIVFDAYGIHLAGNDPIELYVCSNICNVTHVGGNRQRLLRRFLTRTQELEYFDRVLNPVYYTSTVLTRCNEIEISIVDREGSLLSDLLEHAQTTVVLHFKRRAYMF
jgi:hypothetical protein